MQSINCGLPSDNRMLRLKDPLIITLGKDSYSMSVFETRVGAGELFASAYLGLLYGAGQD
jgi:hypothetical protein